VASIVRRRGSVIWTVFFRDENGKQHCRSTKATNKRQAQRIADGYERARIGVAQAVGLKGSKARTKPDHDANEIMRRYVVGWKKLFKQAESGKSWAVHQLVWSVCAGVELLQQIEKSNDQELIKVLRYFARFRSNWPVMKSPHPKFDCDRKEMTEIFRNIELGENLPFLLGKEARSKHDKLAEIVIDLISKVGVIARLYEIYNDRDWLFVGKRQRLPSWAKGAVELPPLTKETADLWWKYVRLLFDKKFPNPSEDPTFKTIVRKKGSPGVINSAVRDQVRQKIHSLARK